MKKDKRKNFLKNKNGKGLISSAVWGDDHRKKDMSTYSILGAKICASSIVEGELWSQLFNSE